MAPKLPPKTRKAAGSDIGAAPHCSYFKAPKVAGSTGFGAPASRRVPNLRKNTPAPQGLRICSRINGLPTQRLRASRATRGSKLVRPPASTCLGLPNSRPNSRQPSANQPVKQLCPSPAQQLKNHAQQLNNPTALAQQPSPTAQQPNNSPSKRGQLNTAKSNNSPNS